MNELTEHKAALVVEYDGTRYHGFQDQPELGTVQFDIESAIQRLTSEKVRVRAAGRTDSGVHAKGQVVAFSTGNMLPSPKLISGLNHFLPEDIAVKEAYHTDSGFDPRRHALSRLYEYAIINSRSRSPLRERYAVRVREKLDDFAMRKALKYLEGVHDFANLSGPVLPGMSTIRNIWSTSVQRKDDTLKVRVEANAFLPNQMRRIAGLLVAVGSKRVPAEGALETLQGTIDPWSTGVARTMAPQGLCLMQVNYKDFPPDGY